MVIVADADVPSVSVTSTTSVAGPVLPETYSPEVESIVAPEAFVLSLHARPPGAPP